MVRRQVHQKCPTTAGSRARSVPSIEHDSRRQDQRRAERRRTEQLRTTRWREIVVDRAFSPGEFDREMLLWFMIEVRH